jgi:hypothetical protein
VKFANALLVVLLAVFAVAPLEYSGAFQSHTDLLAAYNLINLPPPTRQKPINGAIIATVESGAGDDCLFVISDERRLQRTISDRPPNLRPTVSRWVGLCFPTGRKEVHPSANKPNPFFYRPIAN